MHPRTTPLLALAVACQEPSTPSTTPSTTASPVAPGVGTVTVHLPPVGGDPDRYVMVADPAGQHLWTVVTHDPIVVLADVPLGGAVTWGYRYGGDVLYTVTGVADGDVLWPQNEVLPAASGTFTLTVPDPPPVAPLFASVNTPCASWASPVFPGAFAGELRYACADLAVLPAMARVFVDPAELLPAAIAFGTAPVTGLGPDRRADVALSGWISDYGRTLVRYEHAGAQEYVDLQASAMVGTNALGGTAALGASPQPGDALDIAVPSVRDLHDRLVVSLRVGDQVASALYRAVADLPAQGEAAVVTLAAAELAPRWDAPRFDPATLTVERPLPEGWSCGGAAANFGAVDLVTTDFSAFWTIVGPYSSTATRPQLDPLFEDALADQPWALAHAAVAAVPGGFDSPSAVTGDWRVWAVSPGSDLCVLESYDPQYY